MNRFIHRLGGFWREDRSLSLLLVFLFVTVFIAGPLGLAARWEGVSQAAYAFLLLSGLAVVAPKKRVVVPGLIVIVVDIALGGIARSVDVRALDIAGSSLDAVLVATMMVIVLLRSVREGRVTGHRLSGAVAAYLLCGLFFAYAFAVVDGISPGAFTATAGLDPPSRDWSGFLYCSLVTLATLGYGDITPLHPAARSLASLEAFIGQLYPAILIARLVALEMEDRRDRAA
jgi:hypothetical protein